MKKITTWKVVGLLNRFDSSMKITFCWNNTKYLIQSSKYFKDRYELSALHDLKNHHLPKQMAKLFYDTPITNYFFRYINKHIIDNISSLELKNRLERVLNLHFKLYSASQLFFYMIEIDERIFDTLKGLTTEEIKRLNKDLKK